MVDKEKIPMRYEPLFINGDAKKLPILNNSVDLIVTHPPYLGINVDRYGGEESKQINYKQDINVMIKSLVKSTKEMERVLSPKGSIFICIGGSKEASMPYRYLTEVLNKTNLFFLGEILWTYSDALPEERLSKSHGLWFHLVKDINNIYHNPFMVKRYSLSPWNLPINNADSDIDKTLSKDGFTEDSFPEEFPRRFIEMFTKPGQIVLDPFGGTGVAMSEAYKLGRKSITNDISEDQISLAQERLKLIKEML